jgi:peroxiredoxin
MGHFGVVASWLLAAVFAIAGVAKLASLSDTARSLAGFGIPERASRAAAVALAMAELVVAALLPLASTRGWGAVAAIALLSVFILVLARTLARGEAPACQCFGNLSAAQIGWGTVGRNTALLAVAAFVYLIPSAGEASSIIVSGATGSAVPAPMLIAATSAIIGIPALGWVVLLLWQQQGRLLTRIEQLEAGAASGEDRGLPPGTAAPDFALPDASGRVRTLTEFLGRSRPVVLVFVDPNCGPCNSLLPDIAGWQRETRDRLELVVISRGSATANALRAAEHGLSHLLLQQNHEVAALYRAALTPSAVRISAAGRIESALARGSGSVQQLVEAASGIAARAIVATRTADADARAVAAVPAPDLVLQDVDGRSLRLSAFRGQRVLLLFWNAQCGHCRALRPTLERWLAGESGGNLQVLIVASGSPEANRADPLPGALVLDPDFAVGLELGVTGTPAAIAIDSDGRIAAPVAVGGEAVMNLAAIAAVADD